MFVELLSILLPVSGAKDPAIISLTNKKKNTRLCKRLSIVLLANAGIQNNTESIPQVKKYGRNIDCSQTPIE